MNPEQHDLASILEQAFTKSIREAVDAFMVRASALNGVKVTKVYSEGNEALRAARENVLHACELDTVRDIPESEQRRAELDAAVNVWLDELEGFLLNTSHPDNPEDWPDEIQSFRDNIERCGVEAINLP